jgi:hypothetical protein
LRVATAVFAQQCTTLAEIRIMKIGFRIDNLSVFIKKVKVFEDQQKSEHKARFFVNPNCLGYGLDYFKSDKTD